MICGPRPEIIQAPDPKYKRYNKGAGPSELASLFYGVLGYVRFLTVEIPDPLGGQSAEKKLKRKILWIFLTSWIALCLTSSHISEPAVSQWKAGDDGKTGPSAAQKGSDRIIEMQPVRRTDKENGKYYLEITQVLYLRFGHQGKRIKLLSKILSEGTVNFTFSFVYERIQLLGAFTRGYDGQPYSRGSLALFCKNEKPGGNMRKNLHIRLNLSILRVTERRMKQEGKADGGKGHD